MSFEGTIVNGTVVWDEPLALPEGTRVNLVVEVPEEAASDLGNMLLRHAGKAKGLPADAAAQHDHYLYGTPKR
jgi:hypothetical protein